MTQALNNHCRPNKERLSVFVPSLRSGVPGRPGRPRHNSLWLCTLPDTTREPLMQHPLIRNAGQPWHGPHSPPHQKRGLVTHMQGRLYQTAGQNHTNTQWMQIRTCTTSGLKPRVLYKPQRKPVAIWIDYNILKNSKWGYCKALRITLQFKIKYSCKIKCNILYILNHGWENK